MRIETTCLAAPFSLNLSLRKESDLAFIISYFLPNKHFPVKVFLTMLRFHRRAEGIEWGKSSPDDEMLWNNYFNKPDTLDSEYFHV